MKLVCHIHTQQRCSTEKDEDVNWVRDKTTNSEESFREKEDTPHGSCTVLPRLALRNPHNISAEFIGFCKVSCDIYHTFYLIPVCYVCSGFRGRAKPNLLRQETCSLASLLRVLFLMLNDPNRHDFRPQVQERLLG